MLYFKKQDTARIHIKDIPTFEAEVGIVDSQMAAQICNAVDVTGKTIPA